MTAKQVLVDEQAGLSSDCWRVEARDGGAVDIDLVEVAHHT